MAKHSDEGAAGVRSADGDFDLGVGYVPGQYFHRLEMFPGGGRHVLHDERSLAYDAAPMVEHITQDKTTFHRRAAPIWDQGSVGACTAFAGLGLMMTEPFVGPEVYTPEDALRFYSRETWLDDRQIPGRYPPEDTGSTGLWSMKLLKLEGLIDGYRHAFSMATVKKLLQVSPVSIGIPWYNSMFKPDHYGRLVVDLTSGLAGGHQLEGTGVDFENREVELTNSWGVGWGWTGRARISFADLAILLRQHGDCSVPTGRIA